MEYIVESQLLKRDDKMVCIYCHGNGIVKFEQGVSGCPRCNGIGIMICNL